MLVMVDISHVWCSTAMLQCYRQEAIPMEWSKITDNNGKQHTLSTSNHNTETRLLYQHTIFYKC